MFVWVFVSLCIYKEDRTHVYALHSCTICPDIANLIYSSDPTNGIVSKGAEHRRRRRRAMM